MKTFSFFILDVLILFVIKLSPEKIFHFGSQEILFSWKFTFEDMSEKEKKLFVIPKIFRVILLLIIIKRKLRKYLVLKPKLSWVNFLTAILTKMYQKQKNYFDIVQK